jgi:hypothetical protein
LGGLRRETSKITIYNQYLNRYSYRITTVPGKPKAKRILQTDVLYPGNTPQVITAENLWQDIKPATTT